MSETEPLPEAAPPDPGTSGVAPDLGQQPQDLPHIGDVARGWSEGEDGSWSFDPDLDPDTPRVEFEVPSFEQRNKQLDQEQDSTEDTTVPPDPEAPTAPTGEWKEREDGTHYLDIARSKSQASGKATWRTGDLLQPVRTISNPRTRQQVKVTGPDHGVWEQLKDGSWVQTAQPKKAYEFEVEVVGSKGFDQENREWFELTNGTYAREDELQFHIDRTRPTAKAVERVGDDGLTARERYKIAERQARSTGSGDVILPDVTGTSPTGKVESEIETDSHTNAPLNTRYGTVEGLPDDVIADPELKIITIGPDDLTQAQRIAKARAAYEGKLFGKPISHSQNDLEELFLSNPDLAISRGLRGKSIPENDKSEFSIELRRLTDLAREARAVGDRQKYGDILTEMADLTEAHTTEKRRPLSDRYIDTIEQRLAIERDPELSYTEELRDIVAQAKAAKDAGERQKYTDLLFEMAELVAKQSKDTKKAISDLFVEQIDKRLGNEDDTTEVHATPPERPPMKKRIRKRLEPAVRKPVSSARRKLYEGARRTYSRIEAYDRLNREKEADNS